MINSVTVCICTHNRSSLLTMVLDKMEIISKTISGYCFDLLIVDNGSKDNTRDVAAHYVANNPEKFRYIFEEKLGLSNARNRGLKESASDVIVFIDDDAVPRDGWLEGLLEGFLAGENVGVVGGQVILALPKQGIPRWLKKPLYEYYSEKVIVKEGLADCASIVDYPYGANISFRRKLAIEMGGFNARLGRIGNQMLSGEETQLCHEIKKNGYRILLNSKSMVDHHIPLKRITVRNLLKQAWGDGKVCLIWSCDDFVPLETKFSFAAAVKCIATHAIALIFKPPTACNLVKSLYETVRDFSFYYHSVK